MPRSARTRLERDTCATHPRRFRRIEQLVNANTTRKPISQPFARLL
jgi:hypothetical protein